MSPCTGAVLAGLVAAALVDLWAYLTFGELRAIVTRHHWIFYLYLGIATAIVVSGTVAAVEGVYQRFRRRRWS